MSLTGRITARLLFYPTLLWNSLLCLVVQRRNWWDDVDDYLILGAIPFSGDIKKLSDIGVACIINLCAESDGPVNLYRKYGMQYFKIPTVDYTCPSKVNIDLGVSIINRYIKQKKRVYIHCKAGRGRSATVVYCWLVKCRDYSPEDAMRCLLTCRPHANKHIHKRLPVIEYLDEL